MSMMTISNIMIMVTSQAGMDATLHWALLLLQASATSLAAGALLWMLLTLALRLRPGLAGQRGVWLLAMAAAAAVSVLVLWPGSADLRMLPAMDVTAQAVMQDMAMASGADVEDALPALALGGSTGKGWLALAGMVWQVLYGAGLVQAVRRIVMARRAVRGLLASAQPLPVAGRAQHAGFAHCANYVGPPVLETPAAISPMLVGCRQPRLLLPRHLRDFDPSQQQMIIAHELTHWQRRDHWWLHASLVLQTVFWFNPALQALAGRLHRAQELGCDRMVLARRTMQDRRHYAAALLAQLKFQLPAMSTVHATAFGGAGQKALAERIGMLRLPDLGAGSRLRRGGQALLAAGGMAVLVACMTLQPALAWRGAPQMAGERYAGQDGNNAGDGGAMGAAVGANADANAGTNAAATTGATTAINMTSALPLWRLPLAQPRISSPYGPRPRPIPTAASFHHGIDFAAKRGTPVVAPAAGTVLESTALYQGQAKFGNVVVIDHGQGLVSMYAHLDQRAVRPGQAIAAGEVIGKSGNTGKTSGPHLHWEVQHNGSHIDPAMMVRAAS